MKEELIFEITTQLAGMEGTNKAVSSLNQIGQGFEGARQRAQEGSKAIITALDTQAAQASAVAQVFQKDYARMSFNSLVSELDRVEKKIESQRVVAQQAIDEWNTMLEIANQTSPNEFPDYMNAYADAANAAEQQLKALEAEQQRVKAAIVTTQEAAGNNSGMKQQMAQSKLGINALSSALTSLSFAAGGDAGQFIMLAMQARNLQNEFTQTAKTAGTMAAGITAGLGIAGLVFSAIMMIVNAVSQASEEAKKKLEEFKKATKDLGEKNSSTAQLVNEFEQLSNKAVKSTDDLSRMKDISEELTKSYGYRGLAITEEGKALQNNLDIMKEQLQISEKKYAIDLKKVVDDSQSNYTNATDDYSKKLERQKYLLWEIDAAQKRVDDARAAGITNMSSSLSFDIDWIQKGKNELTNVQADIEKDSSAIQEQISNTLELARINLGDKASQIPEYIFNELQKGLETASQGGKQYSPEDIQKILEGYIGITSDIDPAIVDKLTGNAKNLIQTIQSNMAADLAVSAPDKTADENANFIETYINGIIDSPGVATDMNRLEELKKKVTSFTANDQ